MADSKISKISLTETSKNMLENLLETDVISITKIIASLSIKFVTKFPFLVFDDCIQEAWRELIKYQNYYTPGKSKVTTWVYKLVSDTLTSYAQREYSKTQKWDDIESCNLQIVGKETPAESCAYSDLVNELEIVLSPYCYKLLRVLEANPNACQAELARSLKLPERDITYLKEELRTTTQHVLGM